MNWQEHLEGRIGLAEVKSLAKAIDTKQLFEYIYCPEPKVASNAAWVMTHKSDSEIQQLPQDRLIDLILSTPDTSIRRLALNLVERQEITVENLRTDFLDFCLQHMVMIEESTGVQALCMKLAYRMCQYYPELQHEFNASLQMVQKEFYRPGVLHLINKYLRGTPYPTKTRCSNSKKKQ